MTEKTKYPERVQHIRAELMAGRNSVPPVLFIENCRVQLETMYIPILWTLKHSAQRAACHVEEYHTYFYNTLWYIEQYLPEMYEDPRVVTDLCMCVKNNVRTFRYFAEDITPVREQWQETDREAIEKILGYINGCELGVMGLSELFNL